jgi:putative ABC transport system permease protein
MRAVWSDIRYGARMLARNPGSTAAAVVTLALGIGANTAIFSIVDAVLLRPLPFKDPAQLVLLTESNPGKVDKTGVSYPSYTEWQNQNTVFEETAAYVSTGATDDLVLGLPDFAERVQYSAATTSFFSILAVRPALGRAFVAAEEQPGNAKVFLASDALWRRSFAADPHAIGKTFLLDGENFQLIGVMPSWFQFPQGCDVWLPVGALGRELQDRISHPLRVLGRLRPGVNIQQAAAQIDGIQQQIGKANPATDAQWRVRPTPLLEEFAGNARASLLVLLGAVGFILLIACANVGNLLLAHATSREREFAIRAALGADARRLLRQALTESLLLVSFSGSLALLVAKVTLPAAVALSAGRIPRIEQVALDGRVLAFAAILALATAVLVSLAPVVHIGGVDIQESLREGQRGATRGPRSQRVRNALVVSEIALTLLLLCGAALMLKSFLDLNRVSPGFRPEHLLTMKIALPSAQYTSGKQTSVLLDEVLERLKALPGVESVAATTTLPLSGEWNWGSFNIAGQPTLGRENALSAEWRGISADYFRTMGIPLLRGRQFKNADSQENLQVAIINQAMARRFWPGKDPIGQHLLSFDRPPKAREIIGIVGDVKSFGLDAESKTEYYTPYSAFWYMNLVLRSKQDPAVLAPAVQREIAAVDRSVAVYRIATIDQLLARSLAPQRLNLFLLAALALLALVLAVIGIYGVLAFGVSRRLQEIGVRMALGAQPGEILRLIVGQGMKIVSLGLVLGAAASFVLTRLMASLLYKVNPTDPLTFVATAIFLALVALAACYFPARTAMRVEPVTALRQE